MLPHGWATDENLLDQVKTSLEPSENDRIVPMSFPAGLIPINEMLTDLSCPNGISRWHQKYKAGLIKATEADAE